MSSHVTVVVDDTPSNMYQWPHPPVTKTTVDALLVSRDYDQIDRWFGRLDLSAYDQLGLVPVKVLAHYDWVDRIADVLSRATLPPFDGQPQKITYLRLAKGGYYGLARVVLLHDEQVQEEIRKKTGKNFHECFRHPVLLETFFSLRPTHHRSVLSLSTMTAMIDHPGRLEEIVRTVLAWYPEKIDWYCAMAHHQGHPLSGMLRRCEIQLKRSGRYPVRKLPGTRPT